MVAPLRAVLAVVGRRGSRRGKRRYHYLQLLRGGHRGYSGGGAECGGCGVDCAAQVLTPGSNYGLYSYGLYSYGLYRLWPI